MTECSSVTGLGLHAGLNSQRMCDARPARTAAVHHCCTPSYCVAREDGQWSRMEDC